MSELGDNSLFRFVKVLLQVGHEGGAAGAHGRGIGCTGLVLAVDVAVSVADVDLPKLCQ